MLTLSVLGCHAQTEVCQQAHYHHLAGLQATTLPYTAILAIFEPRPLLAGAIAAALLAAVAPPPVLADAKG